MAIKFAYYGWRPDDAMTAKQKMDVLPGQAAGAAGNEVTVANDTVSSPVASSGLYFLYCTSPCTVRIGTGLTDASGGESWWQEGFYMVRFIDAGQVIAVDA